jgi:hypothetical protein
MADVTIARISPFELERLEPLWRSVHEHHQQVAPDLGPYVDSATSWRVRREQYRAYLTGGGFALVAAEADVDLGHALVAIRVDDPFWADTWVVGSRVAELESLAVVSAARRLQPGPC